jgi:hypothetical protein
MRTRGDKGTILPIVAMSMLALLTMVAIVIDLGATRSLRRDARSASDAGATAGALAIGSPTSGSACTDALGYTLKDLGVQTSASISDACTPLSAACSGTTARVATLKVDNDTTVRVTNPVPDTSPLMQGTSEGSGVAQAVNATADGAPCDRVGVEVTQSQPAFFRGAVGGGAATFTVHSVAKFYPSLRNAIIPPALVALNQTTCKAIDAGNNGNIILVGNSVGPGIAYSDSDGSAGSCSSSNPILASRSSGRLVAESLGSVVGQLGWYSAPTSLGYNGSASTNQTAPATFASTTQNYVGLLYARTQRTTRVPVDKRFHCTNVPTSVQPLCSTPDPIAALQALSSSSASAAPGGYTVYSGPCDTTAGAITFPSGNVWVNCPTFTVKGNSLSIPGGGTVIFNGSLSVEAGGNLLSNTSGALDSSGYPIATDPSHQTTLLINSTGGSAFNIASNSSSVLLAQTTVYNSGGLTLQASHSINWTPPPAGDALFGLLYWSESTQQFSIQGSPQIFARGIMFHGNGQLVGSGGGTIDLTNVQMWVDTMATNGSTTVKLAADPSSAINVAGAGSALIR